VDSTKLSARTYNLNAISFTPGEIAAAIRKRVPTFTIKYVPDFRQAIADSWPRSLDDHKVRCAVVWLLSLLHN
jgi:threonine 3-dehydrogenase